jgi:mRNA interferase MazF
MKRGQIWTASGGKEYAAKPRPVVVFQSDRFSALESVTVCPFTTDPISAPFLRIAVEPSSGNGLEQLSKLMVDKLTTVPKSKLGKLIGRLEPENLARLDQAVLVFLGFAD